MGEFFKGTFSAVLVKKLFKNILQAQSVKP